MALLKALCCALIFIIRKDIQSGHHRIGNGNEGVRTETY